MRFARKTREQEIFAKFLKKVPPEPKTGSSGGNVSRETEQKSGSYSVKSSASKGASVR